MSRQVLYRASKGVANVQERVDVDSMPVSGEVFVSTKNKVQ